MCFLSTTAVVLVFKKIELLLIEHECLLHCRKLPLTQLVSMTEQELEVLSYPVVERSKVMRVDFEVADRRAFCLLPGGLASEDQHRMVKQQNASEEQEAHRENRHKKEHPILFSCFISACLFIPHIIIVHRYEELDAN